MSLSFSFPLDNVASSVPVEKLCSDRQTKLIKLVRKPYRSRLGYRR